MSYSIDQFKGTKGTFRIAFPDSPIVTAGQYGIIANCILPEGREDEMHANAKLVAASKENLEQSILNHELMLQIHTILGGCVTTEDKEKLRQQLRDRMVKTLAGIEKVLGE